MMSIVKDTADDEKDDELRPSHIRDKINAETRKYELAEDTKQARKEAVAYYMCFNATVQRTTQRKVNNYNSDIVYCKDGTRVELADRIYDKYAILRAALKENIKY